MIINPYIFGSKAVYGYLYNWYTIDGNASNFITGLRVPTKTDHATLSTYLGGNSVAGGKLKETGTDNWLTPNTSATDTYNFTALPGGYVSGYDGNFYGINENAFFYLYVDSTDQKYMYMSYDSAYLSDYLLTGNETAGYSIRCMRTLTAQEQLDYEDGEVVESKSDYDGNSYDVVRIGTQGWTNTNLKTTHYLNGTALTKVTDATTWAAKTSEAYCSYNNDEDYV